MSPTPAEMVRMACAEVGVFPNVRDRVTEPGTIETLDVLADFTVIRRAWLLVALRLRGAGGDVRCAQHSGEFGCCGMVSVAEALRYPDMTCGLP